MHGLRQGLFLDVSRNLTLRPQSLAEATHLNIWQGIPWLPVRVRDHARAGHHQHVDLAHGSEGHAKPVSKLPEHAPHPT